MADTAHRGQLLESGNRMTIINPYRFAEGGGLLLDDVSGAAAAYSLRLLRTAYSGAAIRVRRSSDNAEQDIGFSGGGLDTSALSAFVGANDGFVATWYDQSGNGYDATQATTTAQPRIVGSGTIDTDSGADPAPRFNGAELVRADFNPTTLAQPVWYSFVAERAVGGARYFFDSADGAARNIVFSNGSVEQMFAGTTVATTATQDTNRYLYSALFNGASSKMWRNGSDVSPASSPGTQGMDGITIGARFSSTSHLFGYITEMVLWEADQTANRSTIEDNIATYYGITL